MKDLKSPEKKFRPELEGIRAVAAILVAVYHIWIGSVSGGVDVFFIVSGYLITTSVLSKMERVGRLNYGEYLLGLGKRLFPIAYTVLLVSAALSIIILPQSFWQQTVSELFASMLYFQNWQLATSAVNYLAQNNEASPFQHFWALSIQGQFYITWPLIISLVFLLALKVFKTPARKTLLAMLAVIFTASLSYSIYITGANQPWAYFDTFARAWEFSLGGLVALLIPYLQMNKIFGMIAGWSGLLIICFTGIVLPVSSVFPGYAALLPTTGVILVILSAENDHDFGVKKLLGSKLFLYLGSISYGFYLWHWPLLIFYYSYFGTDQATVLAGVAIILITYLLSVISVKYIEAPIRDLSVKNSKAKIGKVLTAMALPVILLGSTWGIYVQASQNQEYTVEDHPGARAVSDNIQPAEGVDIIPGPLQAKSHLPDFYEDEKCSTAGKSSAVNKCSYGETENPEKVIALVGGSHSGHWFPALNGITEEHNLQIDVYIKDACRFSTDDFDGLLKDHCMEWNEKVDEELVANPPDLIFTTANVNNESTIPRGYLEKWKEYEGVTKVLAVRDNPRMPVEIPLCLEETPEDCSISREEGLSAEIPWENTDGIPENVSFADMSEYFCTDDVCPPVIGNVMIYRDEHHLTTMYSETMSSGLERYVLDALGL
ncbi:acyltransferase family protein [Planococcus sp. X10-3]|uniref:acyltransferase family protein n=1 Tax=Planococcus sp. X10-3 TaxID=3061240 RepID=UPI003BAEFA9F